MIIRKARDTEIDRLIPMVKMFHDEFLTEKGLTWNIMDSVDFLTYSIDNGLILIVEEEDNLIGAILGEMGIWKFNTDLKIMYEVGWWIAPEHRGLELGTKLLDRFEEESKAMGADFVLMSSFDTRLEGFYKSRGMKHLEYLFIKEL